MQASASGCNPTEGTALSNDDLEMLLHIVPPCGGVTLGQDRHGRSAAACDTPVTPARRPVRRRKSAAAGLWQILLILIPVATYRIPTGNCIPYRAMDKTHCDITQACTNMLDLTSYPELILYLVHVLWFQDIGTGRLKALCK